MPYSFNPHTHVKVWLSNNREVFMNFENQTRLIEMREQNPQEPIHLIYDSSLLDDKANQELTEFCKENDLTPVDADKFPCELQSDTERELFKFYKDEVNHLKEGGNLGVASDILRWLSPSYKRGSYTDLDVPLDTSSLPPTVSVKAPLLLNIGSLKLLGQNEMVLALNEFIAVADEADAKVMIARVQKAILNKLENYSSDYVDQTEHELSQGSFLNRILVGYLKNRAESLYIKKSTELRPPNGSLSSRGLRAYVNEVMTDQKKYIDFHRTTGESSNDVIKRLRAELKGHLSFIKWLFFRSEYEEIKKVLTQNRTQFVEYMMKKERTLYLKSIVICTTGPIEVGRSLFGSYVMSSRKVDAEVRPLTFSNYDLHHGFLSRNVIPLHEDPISMLRYLGTDVGELNDSSWLDEGMALQGNRQTILLGMKERLAAVLPAKLTQLQSRIESQLQLLHRESKGIFGFIWAARREEKIKVLERLSRCFNMEKQSLDVAAVKKIFANTSLNWDQIFAGFFSTRTKNIIDELKKLCYEGTVFRVAKGKKLSLISVEQQPAVSPALLALVKPSGVKQLQQQESPAVRQLGEAASSRLLAPTQAPKVDHCADGDDLTVTVGAGRR
jgi:glucosyltransferase Lgt1/2/3